MGFLGFGKKRKENGAMNDEEMRQSARETFSLDAGAPPTMPPLATTVSGLPPMEGPPHQPQMPPPLQNPLMERNPMIQQNTIEKDMQLVLSKLDAINAKLENLNRRLALLERLAQDEQQKEQQMRTVPRRMW